MKHLIPTILFVTFSVCSCSSKPKEKERKFPADEQLIKTWQSFKEALNRSDTTTLLSLSYSCILCSLCSPPKENLFMPARKFYQDHFHDVFNDRLLSFVNDSTKVRAAYDNNSTFTERDSCLKINSPSTNKLADVFVGIPIEGEEGLTVLVHFAKTASGFKFYGVSTIPWEVLPLHISMLAEEYFFIAQLVYQLRFGVTE